MSRISPRTGTFVIFPVHFCECTRQNLSRVEVELANVEKSRGEGPQATYTHNFRWRRGWSECEGVSCPTSKQERILCENALMAMNELQWEFRSVRRLLCLN